MPRKKTPSLEKEKAKPLKSVKTAKKRVVRKKPTVKKSPVNESLSIPPIVTIEELVVPTPPTTQTWFAVLHDGRVYKATTTILNRVVLISSIAVYIIAFVLAGLSTFALEKPPTDGAGPAVKDAGIAAGFTSATDGATVNIGYVVAKFLYFFFGVLGMVFMCYIFYAGFVWLTAGGDEKKITSARDIILHSILGLIVCAASFAISYGWLASISKFVAP